MRLIDADALTNHIKDELCFPVECEECTFFQPYDKECILKIWVDNAPTIDTERRGKWKDIDGDGQYWECSVCGEVLCCNNNFCPNCGAKMDGERDELEKIIGGKIKFAIGERIEE